MKFFESALCGALFASSLVSAVPTYDKRHPRANPKPEQFRELFTRTYNKRHVEAWNGTETAPHTPSSTGWHPTHKSKPHGGKQSRPGKKPFGFHPHHGHGPKTTPSSTPSTGGNEDSEPEKGDSEKPGELGTCKLCPKPESNEIEAPYDNIWLGLTHDEAADVTKFLFENESLNLTVAENATEWDNTVLLVELLLPNKTDALNYLDSDGSAPDRYAHVILDFRATEEPYMQDFQVGPIPITEESTIQPLNYMFNKGTGKQRNYNADEGTRSEWLAELALEIEDITLDLWNMSIANDNVYLWGIDPFWQEEDRIIAWDQFWATSTDQFGDSTLLPLGLYVKSDFTGRDPSQWKVLGWVYNDIFYETADILRAAWSSPGFVKNGPNVDGPWAQTDREGPILKRDTMFAPMQIAPEGSRYEIDIEKQYVDWMGFTFYIAFSRDTGVRLFDIRYNGERIIYELGLMEALAHYAGNDPTQSGTAYLDTFYGFGPYTFQLVPGFDCPAYSTFLNSTFYAAEKSRTHPGSICVFEADAGYPMGRHTTEGMVYVSKNIHLTVRSVATVGNYDYMFDYKFYLDGGIGIDVRASGYIQSAYFAANNEYGYKIHDNLSGSMHDHVLAFKADFDILGTKNSVATTEFIPTVETYSWSGGKSRNTMKLKKGFIESEDEASINWPANNNKHIMIVNTDEAGKNKYGEYRGYRIAPSTPPVHLTVEASTNLKEAAEWAKHHMYITQRKDTEASLAHPYNSLDVENPVVNFKKFLDGESLKQEDLVVWFNLGMHHAPNTADLPNTVFTTAHAGVMLEPVNYHLQNPSKQTVHAVRVSYDDGDVMDVETYGVNTLSCPYNLEKLHPDLTGYQGDVVIRKFPYDPNDWYFDTESI